MSMRSLFAGGCALLLAGTAAAGAQAGNGAPAVACGDTITADTTLTANLTCAGNGLVVIGPAVLDLAGRKIKGDGTGTGVELRGEGSAVRDGAVNGFATGVLVNAGQSRVEEMKIKNNAEAGIQFVSHRNVSVVAGNDVNGNGFGISFSNDNRDVQVLDNDVNHNTKTGIMASHGVDRSLFQGNRVNENALSGMAIYDSTATIRDNQFNRNGGDGLVASELSSLQFWLIGGNNANRNGGHGINVLTPGIPDGGGNSARGNAIAPQCVNIAC